MIINHLVLANFRNYQTLDQSLPAGIVALFGDNAQGKTSFIEAIAFLATSRSPYAAADRQVINWESEKDPLPFARVTGTVTAAEISKTLEITMMLENASSGRLKKKIAIDGVEKPAFDLLGNLRVVMFLPRDIDLVEGAPSDRRRYLDLTLCQVDPAYCRALSKYNHVLSQRNALLKNASERGRLEPDEIAFWDQQLASTGATVFAARARMIDQVSPYARAIHAELSGGLETLAFQYIPGLAEDIPPDDLPPSLASAEETEAAFLQVLFETRTRDLRRGTTTTGPQRDELRFLVNGRDLGYYGSRGQNRTAVLATRLAELEWMTGLSGEAPVLLLDEVGAELDPQRRAYLMSRIAKVPQAILTTAEPYLLEDDVLKEAALFRVTAGTLAPFNKE